MATDWGHTISIISNLCITMYTNVKCRYHMVFILKSVFKLKVYHIFKRLKTAISPGGGYSSSSRAGRLGRTLWPQNSTSVAETEKGGQNSTMTPPPPPPPPPTLEKGGQYSTSVWKVCKKGGQKSTILKNIGVKILQVWKWGSKFYMLKNRGQNSTMLEKRGVNILHPTPKVEVKILHRLKKGGQKGRAYPLPKI